MYKRQVLLIPFSEPLAQWFMMLSLQSLTVLWYYLELLRQLPYAIISLSFIQELLVLVMGLVTFVICYFSPFLWDKLGKRCGYTSLGLVISVSLLSIIFLHGEVRDSHLWSKKDKYPNHDIEQQAKYGFTSWSIIFFDVGQGTSVLVKRDNHAILYDTGAAYPSGFNMSDAVILPFLQYSAIEHLDKVIVCLLYTSDAADE